MAVPLVDLAPQHQALLPAFTAAFDKVVRSGQFILGPFVESFERDLAAYCQSKFALAMSSGTDALLAAFMALDLKPGEEVITSPFTFFATAGCIARAGGKPVFVDIDPRTYNLDPSQLDAAITPRTRAICPVHLFGQCADMRPIMDFARKHHLVVIEDAAQAIGAKYHGQMAGAIGDIGCLSFYPTKNLAVMGDGGAVLTEGENLAKRMKCLRLHGQTGEYQHEYIGGNFRFDALKAAMLSIKLPHLDAWTEARRVNAARYDELLAGLPVGLPVTAAGCYHVFNQYTIRVPDGRRDALKAHLAAKQIGHRVYYPLPLHLQPCFAYLGVTPGALPESERAAREVLSLPIYPELTAAQQEEVAAAVRAFFRA